MIKNGWQAYGGQCITNRQDMRSTLLNKGEFTTMKYGQDEISKYNRLAPYKCAIPEENGVPLYLHQGSNHCAAMSSAKHPINTLFLLRGFQDIHDNNTFTFYIL